jgi:Tfp pilus assembly protein PilF
LGGAQPTFAPPHLRTFAPLAPFPWIARPSIDLLIGCGGWSAPLLLVAYLLVQPQADRWAILFYALALVVNYPHYMATIHRAYARLEDRTAHRLFTHYVTVLLAAIAIAAHAWPALLPWLFTAYVMWSPWHYTGQNFGLSMMFLRRAGVDVSKREREWLHGAFIASFLLLLAAFNQGASRDRAVLSLGLPDQVAWSIEMAGALVFAGGSLLAFGSLARRTPWRALVPALTLCSTQAMWFVAPVLISRLSNVPNPQVSYSTGVLALMHSAQYLWITQHYARRDTLRRDGASAWNRARYWTVLILGGMAIFIPLPWIASLIGHADFASSVLIVAATVNLHHFILDGVVWKLRDPKVSQALVQVESPAPALDLQPAPRPKRARYVLAAAGVAVVALALVDQVRYAMTSPGADIAALERARTLNPRDSRVHLALIKLLIESNRLADAYREDVALLELSPANVDALVNAGVLAQRLGNADDAARWWTRALAQDDSRGDVHLYLAELLDARGRSADALPHYQRHLELVATRAVQADSRQTALVLIKFADALGRSGRPGDASAQYRLAARIARASGLNDIETMAIEREEAGGH